jgi:hypothetical protein
LGGLKKEGFLAHRSVSRTEDETEIRADEETFGSGYQGHSPSDPAALFGGR